MKTITIDGIEYDLLPKKASERADYHTTSFYGCITDCGTFEFQILLDEDTNIWEGTETITYMSGKDNEEIWDHSDLIKGWLRGDLNSSIKIEENLNYEEIKSLNNLKDMVNKLGWSK